MKLKNSDTRYGFATKLFHWAIFLIFLNQFIVAFAMLNTPQGATTAGFTQGALYNWHKSIGLIALFVALLRYTWRKTTPLPNWAPHLSDREKLFIHWIERILYICMFVMPLSGFVFVMTGGYGVHFFSQWHLPNFLGENATIALFVQWTHRITAWLIVLTLFTHWGLGIRHQIVYRDRYLQRMLPFTSQER
jgi:cytochrome b561